MRSSTNWKKKTIALVTAITMTMGLMPAAGAAVTIETTAPKVTVVAALVENGAFLEVGLHIDSAEKTFQSAGVVLRYDPSKLQPANWKTATEAEPELYKMTVLHSSDSGDADETPLAQAWQKATPLPTKGADEMAGKLAKAFTRGGTAEAPEFGYVMLSSEQAEAGVMAQTLPGKTDPVPEGIPAATASKLPLTYTDKAEAAVKQTVTVRFAVQKNASAEGEPLYALPALLDALDLVRYDGADTSETVKTVLETAPLSLTPSDRGTLDGVMYIADNAQYTTAGYDSDVQVGFHWIGKGVSVNAGTGGVSMDGVLSVTFYDWDETLLGTLAVPAGEDISQRVNDFAKQFVHPDLNGSAGEEAAIQAMMASTARRDTYRGKYPSTSGDETTIDETGARYPLTNKLDYVFYKGNTAAADYDGFYFAHGWVPVTTETLDARTENGVFTAYTTATEPADKVLDFSKGLTESVMVKAAYVPGDDLDTSIATGLYTITNIAYNRYGTVSANQGSYSIKLTVERINQSKYGVTRLRYPAYRAYIMPDTGGAQEVIVRLDIDSRDTAIGEIVAPKGSSQVRINYVDVTSENWPGVALKANEIVLYKENTTDVEGYLCAGTVAAVNELVGQYFHNEISLAEFNTYVSTVTYEDMDTPILEGNTSLVGGNRTAAPNIARNKLRLAYLGNCKRPMSKNFIADVLYSTLSIVVNTDARYETAAQSVQQALTANSGHPLSAEQIEYAINNNGALMQYSKMNEEKR